MEKQTWSVKDLCERYQVREQVVLRWIHSGELRAMSVGQEPDSKKPRWRVTAEALADFELARSTMPAPKPNRRRRRTTNAPEKDYFAT